MTKFYINAQAIKAVSMAASNDKERPALNCVFIKPNEMVATDSFRMYRYHFYEKIEGVPEEGILFDASLFAKIKASQNVVTFEKIDDDKWAVDSTIAKPSECRFPQSYDSLFEKHDYVCGEFGINPNYVADAMKAVKIINGSRNKEAYAIVNAYSPIKPIHISASNDKNFEAIIMPVRIHQYYHKRITRSRIYFCSFFFQLKVCF